MIYLMLGNQLACHHMPDGLMIGHASPMDENVLKASGMPLLRPAKDAQMQDSKTWLKCFLLES